MINASLSRFDAIHSQPWRFVVMREAAIKRRLGQWYLLAWQATTAAMTACTQPYRHGAARAQQMETVPVLLLACIDHGDAGPGPRPVTRGASIDPAVQHLLLAARALGLGTVLTTLQTQYASDMKARLHIPATVETAAMIPVGSPAEGVRFGHARRMPLAEVVFHDRWSARRRGQTSGCPLERLAPCRAGGRASTLAEALHRTALVLRPSRVRRPAASRAPRA
jgi:nitroreductase